MEGLRDLWVKHAANKKSLADDERRFVAIVDHFGAKTQVARLIVPSRLTGHLGT